MSRSTHHYVARTFRIKLRYRDTGETDTTVLKVVFEERHSHRRAIENTIAECIDLGMFPKADVLEVKAVSQPRVATLDERRLAV